MKILFQGDSVTDACRDREADTPGHGYPVMVAGDLGVREPGKHVFINRGISGNRIVDIYARIKADAWNLAPDVMSLLIGINDVWHEAEIGNGVEADRFERVYRMLIEDTRKACPNLQIILMEPFVLRGTATNEKWDYFCSETAKRREIVKRLAEEYHLPFVPLQSVLDKACSQAPADYWLMDGVHPTSAGHRLIANEWIRKYDEIFAD